MNSLTDVRKFAEELMDTHFGPYRSMWKFEYLVSARNIGLCRGNIFFGGTIFLNEDYAMHAPLDEIKNTMLHEIAHGVTGHGHDRVWRLKFLSMGGDGERINNSEAAIKVAALNAKYVATCPTCGHKEYISRLGSAAKQGRLHCGICARKHGLSDENKLIFVINY